MTPEQLQESTDWLHQSVHGLRQASPELSAAHTVTRRQKIGLVVLFAALVGSAIACPLQTGVTLVMLAMAVYLLGLADRTLLFVDGLNHSPLVRISDAEARAIPDEDLPVYTVLLPAYHEPNIMEELLRGVGRLDYPPHKLDVKLLLEADDADTIAAAVASEATEFAEIVLVPAAEPRTKPKALNYGLFDARGEMVTIYDAEDIPDPLQLRRVVAALRRLPAGTACIQAKLDYHNESENLLTKWFTSEYNQWFGYTLPGLMRVGAPIPLGGTSNHVRLDTLRDVGGWDPFNVTEDADLGIRLARHGYHTAILDSATLEEANSDTINWIRQRSRWYKGYLQTWLVHLRQPRKLWREIGTRGVLRFAGVTAGTPAVAVANMVFWLLTITWILGEPGFLRNLFPTAVYFAALISLVIGNSAVIYMGIIAARADGKDHLAWAALIVPLYWVLMSLAAIKAFVQIVVQPSYWEKTFHGLEQLRSADPAAPGAGQPAARHVEATQTTLQPPGDRTTPSVHKSAAPTAVEVEPAVGALMLPEVAATASAERGSASSAPPKTEHTTPSRRLLIVEDETSMGTFLERVLTRAGFETKHVTSAESALVALRTERYGGVLADIRLPGMTGLELTRRLRADDPDVSIAVMTAHGNPTVAAEAFRSGADEFILKPITPSLLVERVTGLFDRRPAKGASGAT